MARVDGSCANCTDDSVCADHVGDVDAAMRYYDDIDHEADAENILADLHSEMIGGVVDAGRAVRAAPQAAARSGTPLGQVTITGDVIDDPRLVDSEHGPAAIMPVRLAAIGVGGTARASWLTALC